MGLSWPAQCIKRGYCSEMGIPCILDHSLFLSDHRSHAAKFTLNILVGAVDCHCWTCSIRQKKRRKKSSRIVSAQTSCHFKRRLALFLFSLLFFFLFFFCLFRRRSVAFTAIGIFLCKRDTTSRDSSFHEPVSMELPFVRRVNALIWKWT